MSGTVYGVGLGPGAQDLMSVRADRLVRGGRHVAYFRKAGRPGQARRIVEGLLRADAIELPMEYPVTTEIPISDPRYNTCLSAFYAECTDRLLAVTDAGEDVVVLCEGDPFFYGSFMHLHSRLSGRTPVEVVPGITGMAGAWNATGMPITWGDDVLTVAMATLPEEELVRRIRDTDALVVMKIGRHLPKLRRAVEAAGRTDAAWLVEHAAMPGQRITRLADVDAITPYFSILLIHGQGAQAMSGWVAVAGLGPGDEALVTPEVSAALAEATDVVGYIPYVARVAPRAGLTLHPSDNRVELDRAGHALDLAADGRRVVVVSSGDPGVFAMASALFEALEAGPARWQDLDIRILPGITAMLAAAARAGAPLGHDFCAINLSDNLKPWPVIEKRLRLAAEADFAMAFYNPRSKARPEGFARVLEILREACGDARPILFARAVTTAEEDLRIVPLGEARADMADMRTMVIVGSSQTRIIARARGPILYTPRSLPGDAP